MKKRYSFSSSLIAIIVMTYIVAFEIWEGLKINFEYFLPLIALASVYSNLKKFNNKKKRGSNSIPFKTKNDHYYTFLNYFWGFGILISIVIWYFYFEWTILTLLSLLIIGISLIISGIQNNPSGVIKVDSEELSFGNNNKYQYIALNRLNSIKIIDGSIIVQDLHEKKYSINHLDLNSNTIEKLKSFLNSKLEDVIIEK
ncbi:hypothetical protein [Aquimarina sp. AU58]|uniref:hypothetical protein n=1 Tax=Aquimarina sp. AU58 TaxID=1874112 RepID=UPI00135ACB4D|nr:hypothetical protein [Aquimarina sp. AU58]